MDVPRRQGAATPWNSVETGARVRYQVVKTRVQQRFPAADTKFAGDLAGGEVARTMRCVADTWAHEGLRGFFKGCWPNALRVMPSAALTFWTYEIVVNAAATGDVT